MTVVLLIFVVKIFVYYILILLSIGNGILLFTKNCITIGLIEVILEEDATWAVKVPVGLNVKDICELPKAIWSIRAAVLYTFIDTVPKNGEVVAKFMRFCRVITVGEEEDTVKPVNCKALESFNKVTVSFMP